MNVINQTVEKKYACYNADNVEMIRQIPDNSIHYTLFSPPFASLYTYSNSDRDMGNCKGDDEFISHFKFLAKDLYRITMPGRLLSFHCMDLPRMKSRDGVIGLKDFPSILRQIFEDEGFIYHSRVTIWKNPVTEMQRTKALGLLHKQIRKDSSMCRQGIPDYIITMRKPGENPEMISHTYENFPVDVWQQYASPVWMDIRQSDSLQKASAREEKDEKHICFAEGTLVLTKRGYVPIEDVIVNEDETLTHNGNWKKIIAKAMTKENADVIQTKASGVPLLISTPDHKLYAKKSENAKETKWVEAQNCLNHLLCMNMPPVMESKISGSEWFEIGRLLATDGDRSSLSSEAQDFLDRCGYGENKKIPVDGISLNNELSTELFSGYFIGKLRSSGCQNVVFDSESRAFLLGMAIIMHRAFGVSVPIIKSPDGDKWMFDIENESDDVYFLNGENVVEEDSEWKKVNEICDAGKANVWSIQVEDDASYTAEGCVVKNCPLQLGVIQRCIELWTNPNDIVFDPFAGIGSVPYVALKLGRRGLGCELKESYFAQMQANLENALNETPIDQIVGQQSIYDFIDENKINEFENGTDD